MKKDKVVAIAPSAYIPNEICARPIHYVSTRDFVPLFDRMGRKVCQESSTLIPKQLVTCIASIIFAAFPDILRDAWERHRAPQIGLLLSPKMTGTDTPMVAGRLPTRLICLPRGRVEQAFSR